MVSTVASFLCDVYVLSQCKRGFPPGPPGFLPEFKNTHVNRRVQIDPRSESGLFVPVLDR